MKEDWHFNTDVYVSATRSRWSAVLWNNEGMILYAIHGMVIRIGQVVLFVLDQGYECYLCHIQFL